MGCLYLIKGLSMGYSIHKLLLKQTYSGRKEGLINRKATHL